MRKIENKKDSLNFLSLDSLMDILTCIIGILLLIVVFGILQSNTVKIAQRLPRMNISDKAETNTSSIQGHKMLYFYCQNNEFYYRMSWQDMLDGLFVKQRTFTKETVPEVVWKANARKLQDDFFAYSTYYDESTVWDKNLQGFFKYRTWPVLIIKKRNNFFNVNDSTLKTNIQNILNKLDTTQYWINFYVDTSSVLLFREIRKVSDEMGFRIGWTPVNLSTTYPDTLNIMQSGNRTTLDEEPPELRDQNLKR